MRGRQTGRLFCRHSDPRWRRFPPLPLEPQPHYKRLAASAAPSGPLGPAVAAAVAAVDVGVGAGVVGDPAMFFPISEQRNAILCSGLFFAKLSTNVMATWTGAALSAASVAKGKGAEHVVKHAVCRVLPAPATKVKVEPAALAALTTATAIARRPLMAKKVLKDVVHIDVPVSKSAAAAAALC